MTPITSLANRQGFDIHGKTIGIVGTGARLASTKSQISGDTTPCRMTVARLHNITDFWGYDPVKDDRSDFTQCKVTPVILHVVVSLDD